MIKQGMTVKEAAESWVREFSAIPYGICEKLQKVNYDELNEVTPPSRGDRVYVFNLPDDCGSDEKSGEVKKYIEESDTYLIELDDGVEVEVSEGDFDVKRDGGLPMWGTLWAFGEQLDNDWLEDHGGLRAMADCGFRVYEQEDYQYIFGIDGAGYDFYESHWIPLYRARGLHWHDEETEKKGES